MPQVLLSAALAVVVAKNIAYLWSWVEMVRIGGPLADGLRDDAGAPAAHFPALLNPIDRLLANATSGGSVPERLVRVAFTAPAAIVGASVIQFAFGSDDHLYLTYALGASIATCAMFVLGTAVLRRLVLGDDDWKTSDVQVPKVKLVSRWAAAREPGANKSVYFLLMAYLSVLGFAALYLALGAGSGFAGTGDGTTWVTWLYFSFATLATVGYGDVHPTSDVAKIAVSCQIASGPLLLSWLLAAFLSSESADRDGRPTRVEPSVTSELEPDVQAGAL
jgi:hypothetical protein